MKDFFPKRILIVEDDPIISVVLSQKLSKHGFSCHVANSGEKAIDCVDKEEYDAILMDIDLGSGIDGIEAASIVLGRKDIPLLFHTSHLDDENIKRSGSVPHYGYILKNSGDTLLFSGIEKAIEHHTYKLHLKNTLDVFNQITENISEIFWVEDVAESKIYYITPSFEKIFGVSMNSIYESPLEFLKATLPEDKPGVMEFYRNFVNGSNVHTHEYRIQAPNNAIRNIFIRFYPMVVMDGKVQKMVGFAEDRTEIKNYELAQKNKERELNSIVSNLPLPAVVCDPNLIILDWNKAAEGMFGYKKEEAMGISAYDLIIPKEEHNTVSQLKQTAITDNGAIPISNWNRCKDGKLIFCEWRNTPIYDNKNQSIGYVSIAQDITERIQSEERMKNQIVQKEILLKEIHHRVKNNMATISSLLEIHSSSVLDPVSKSHLQDAQSRVNGMMVLYDKLFRSNDYKNTSLQSYLISLVNDLRDLYEAFHIELVIDIEDLDLEPSILFPLGIIVNEIASNSLKHAFSSQDNGKIVIQGRIQILGIYELEVYDNGIGNSEIIRTTPSKGFGMNLIELLTKQIRGNYKYRDQELGLGYTIRFPIPDKK